MAIDVSIITVNYNGRKYLKNYFDSLLHLIHDDFTFEIVFVDNHSTDGSLTLITQNYAHCFNLTVVNAKKNLGFAGGNNLGVEHAQGEYLVFLNNDTAVAPDWLKNLYTCIQTTQAGIVNSKLVFFYDFIKVTVRTKHQLTLSNEIRIDQEKYTLEPKFCQNASLLSNAVICNANSSFYIPLLKGIQDYTLTFFPRDIQPDDTLSINTVSYPLESPETPLSVRIPAESLLTQKATLIQNAGSFVNDNLDGGDIGFGEEDQGQYENLREINNACGAAMIIKKSDFIAAGKFDRRFFAYYEDTDLSYRVKALGKKIVYCPNAVVRHVHAGSSVEWSPFFMYHVWKNKLLFVYKNFPFETFAKHYQAFYRYQKEYRGLPHAAEMKKAVTKAFWAVTWFAPQITRLYGMMMMNTTFLPASKKWVKTIAQKILARFNLAIIRQTTLAAFLSEKQHRANTLQHVSSGTSPLSITNIIDANGILCNLCGELFARSGPDHSEFLVCPRCGCIARERTIWHCILEETTPPRHSRQPFIRENAFLSHYKVLEFFPHQHPERQRIVKTSFQEYLGSDFDLAGYKADIKIDLTQFDDIKPYRGYFDIVICSHVLEHIPDYHKALQHLAALISEKGFVVFQVPLLEHQYRKVDWDEFHGDHTRVFHRFGFDILSELRKYFRHVQPILGALDFPITSGEISPGKYYIFKDRQEPYWTIGPQNLQYSGLGCPDLCDGFVLKNNETSNSRVPL